MIEVVFKSNGHLQTIEFSNHYHLLCWLCEDSKESDFEVISITPFEGD